MFTRGSAEKFSTAKLHSERSAKGPQTVHESSVHPASFGYTGGLPLSKERTVRRRSADSPPVLGRIYQRQFQSGGSVKIQRRTVRQDTADSPRMDRMVGSARLLIMGVPLTPPHQTAHLIQMLSLVLSQARGGDDKVKTFWRGSRTVRAHTRTLLKILHHVFSVF